MTLLATPPKPVPWGPNRPLPRPYPPTGPQLTQPRPGDESNPTPQPPPTPSRFVGAFGDPCHCPGHAGRTV